MKISNLIGKSPNKMHPVEVVKGNAYLDAIILRLNHVGCPKNKGYVLSMSPQEALKLGQKLIDLSNQSADIKTAWNNKNRQAF